MSRDRPWRLAFMFDAQDGDIGQLERQLRNRRRDIQRAAGEVPVRLGIIAQGAAESGAAEIYDFSAWRTVDGAIEIDLAAERREAIADIAQTVGALLKEIVEPASIEGVAGPIHAMVPARSGDVFLSLAFCRDPRTTSDEFQRWWRDQHASVAIPILGDELLAYDQVHADRAIGRLISAALGAPARDYDAYDNLTWADRAAFLRSTGDADGQRLVSEDESAESTMELADLR